MKRFMKSRIIIIAIMTMHLIACHKEKTQEKDLRYYLNSQNDAAQYGRQVLTKHFSAYKQKLVDRNITEIACLPEKNTIREPWHFECKITIADKKVMIIKEDTPFQVIGWANITTNPFVVNCGDILEVSADEMNRETFQNEFDRLLKLFDAKTQRRSNE